MKRSPYRPLAPDEVGPGIDETTSLRGIANKARHDKAHRFGNLYGELNEALLKEAWRRLNKSAASGIDRVTARDDEQELDANIKDLVERLKGKRYRAKEVRRHYIPKADGKKQRPLGIPVVEDKLLQAGVAMILEAIYEPDFLPVSFGYRPGVGARDAVQALGFNLQYGRFGYVVEADIAGFFTHLDHDMLKGMLRERIADESFVGLIGQWLKAGVLEPDGSVVPPEAGTPQGGVVSPILANIYLHHGLDRWFEEIVKPHCRGKAMLIRYADDFVCAFRYCEDAEAFYRVLPKRLARFALEVAPEKTRRLRFSRFHPGRRRRFAFLGFEFYWSVDRQGERRLMKRTARKTLGRALKAFSDWVRTHRHLPTQELFRQVAWKLRGHFNYFGLPGNSRSLKEFHAKALAILLKWLKRRNRRHRMNGWRFYRLVEWLGLPQPRIVPYPRSRSIVLA
jgi:RNA-directed DNA polymerase